MNRIARWLIITSSVVLLTSQYSFASANLDPDSIQVEPADTSKRSAVPKQFAVAVNKANLAVRRAKETESTVNVAKTELSDVFWCEATITKVEAPANKKKVVSAETVVVRPVKICPSAGDQAIQASVSAANSARSQANQSLRSFEKDWEPVKSGKPIYIRTHWGGCRKHWPRITEAEYDNRRNNIIQKGKQAVTAAGAQLEATRAKVREDRQQQALIARTVQLNLQPVDENISVDAIQVGQRVRITFRVETLEIADDSSNVKNPTKYIGTVHGLITDTPRIIETAFKNR